MAMAKLIWFLILTILAISMVATAKDEEFHLDGGRYGSGSVKRNQCPSQCNRRCSRTQYHNACILFCNKCCNKCLCVPPGFYGNKAVCPCYNNWKTKKGGPKCP